MAKKIIKTTTTVTEEIIEDKQSKSAKTYVVMVLDESGSMAHGQDVTINNFNEQIQTLKANTAEGAETLVSLIKFSYTAKVAYENKAVGEVPMLDNLSYVPNGSTSLYDAIGLAVSTVKKDADFDKNSAALIVILTDGEENSSKEFRGDNIGKLVADLEKTNQWTFTLMGPQANLHRMADILNVRKGNIAGFDPFSVNSRSFAGATMTVAVSNYMTNRSLGETTMDCFYSSVESDNQPNTVNMNQVGMVEFDPNKITFNTGTTYGDWTAEAEKKLDEALEEIIKMNAEGTGLAKTV